MAHHNSGKRRAHFTLHLALHANLLGKGRSAPTIDQVQKKNGQTLNVKVQGVHKVLHTFKILISQKPHMVETLDFRR